MSIEVVPEWMVDLDDEDVAFVKRFCRVQFLEEERVSTGHLSNSQTAARPAHRRSG
ncbi:MAG: hypothetical protein ACLTMP_11325 [Eggerthella lenta]